MSELAADTPIPKVSRRNMDNWSRLPAGVLERVMIRLERDDVARSCTVCKSWSSLISSDSFHRNYRKQNRSTAAWVWLVSCVDQQQREEEVEEGRGGTSTNCDLMAWNLHHRRVFKLMEIEPCPPSRCHPERCWFDFAPAEGLLAWACRHTPGSIRIGNPLKPSSIIALPDLPPFPEVVYEFRLGVVRERQYVTSGRDEAGYKVVALRLGFPHAEQQTSSVVLTASVYRSSMQRWEIEQVKVNQELKRWGASVVCKERFYVLLRAPGKHGPGVGMLGFNFNGGHGETWTHQEYVLPANVSYDWQDKMDLVERSGSLMLVIFGFESGSLSIYQAEESMVNRMPRTRWVFATSMPGNFLQQFLGDLGASSLSYRCRGWHDYIFFTSQENVGYVYWISRKTWHRMDFSTLRLAEDSRYLFALGA